MINIGDDEFVLITETAYCEDSGLPRRQETRTPTGLLQVPPSGEPSVIRYVDGKPSTLIWHEQGVEHREEGPSRVTLRPETGNVMTETFKVHGLPRPPSEGPFRIRYKENGEVWQVEHAEAHPFLGDGPGSLPGLEPE